MSFNNRQGFLIHGSAGNEGAGTTRRLTCISLLATVAMSCLAIAGCKNNSTTSTDAGASGGAPSGTGGDGAVSSSGGENGSGGNGGNSGNRGTSDASSGGGGSGGTSGGTGGTASGGSGGTSGGSGGTGGVASGGSGGSSDSGAPDAGGLGGSCVEKLYATYVLRTDGVLIWENTQSSPETIVDASTGLPLAGITGVETAGFHGCASLSNGTAECWQLDATKGNSYGQLGNGTTTASSTLYRATPVLTGGNAALTNVVAIASTTPTGLAGTSEFSHTSCAVTSDGKLWCWGDLTWIVNGGTSLQSGYAQAITLDGSTPLTGVSEVALGFSSACVLISGSPNSVRCWGQNTDGVLGLGDTTNRQYPTPATKVLGLQKPTKILVAMGPESAASSYHALSVACAQDGENVRCWGDNSSGSAGTNTTTASILSPAPVVTQSGTILGGVADLELGFGEFATLRTDGSLWIWGNGFQNYAANYGLTHVLAVGWAGPPVSDGPRYVTSDGVYHDAMSNFTVNCNAM